MKIFLLFFLTFLTFSCSRQSNSVGYQVFLAPHGFEIFYDSWRTQTTKNLYTPGSITLNGSYFGMDSSWASIPAGLWVSENRETFPLRTDDPNLSHVFSDCDGVYSIMANEAWQKTLCSKQNFAFQAWPLVINEWQLASDFSHSWHAGEPHERTLIGLDHSTREVFFFVFPEKHSLLEVGKMIQKDRRFAQRKSFDLLNLDGGPSTAYYDGKKGFRENEKLPIILRITP